MEKLNIIEIFPDKYPQDYIDWCNKEGIELDIISYDKKVEGGDIAMAEKINEIVEFLNNFKK
jgi:hypothetical protein